MAFQAEVILWGRDWGVHAGSTHCKFNGSEQSLAPWLLCVLAPKTVLQGQRIPRKQ